MPLLPVSLDDKYDLAKDRVFVTGFQALVRLCLMQKERDRRAGLNTAGYVTGYRGSPLGTLDQQFMRAGARLKANDVLFHAGTNEDLAATALAGTQTAELRGEGKFDGVFGMWYGKGPGVDRSGDAFRHANFAGTSEAWRRDRADGRRPHRGILHHRAPVRVSFHRRHDPDPQPRRGAGDHGLRPLWLGDVSLHRRLDRARMDARDGKVHGGGRRPSRPREDHPSRRFCDAAGRSQHPAGRHRARPGSPPARFQARRHARLRAGEQAHPHRSLRAAATRRSASSRSARAISTSARRSTSSVSTRSPATTSGCASTRSAVRGRSVASTSWSSRRASNSSSWSRRSAR